MEAAVSEDEQQLKYARNLLVQDALKYARMRVFGTYVEDGRTVRVCHSDRTRYEELFLKVVGESALYLLRCMTSDESKVME